MKETDILIIGGGPAGIVAAVTARKNNPNKKIVLVRKEKTGVIPCGIPYIFNRLDSVEKNIMSNKALEKNNVDLIIDTVIKIDFDNKSVELKNSKFNYKKLILATGSKALTIPISGVDKRGVWQIKKDFNYLKKLRKAVLTSKNIIIIGGGFIGIELAEELSSIKNLNISIIEKADRCLNTTFDYEFSEVVEEKLKKNNVKIYNGKKVEEIGGEKEVEFVKLSGKKIVADLVILSVGSKSNISLIKNTEIKVGKYGGIVVDEYMETSIKDVFAVGDCSETQNLLTKKYFPIMLASTACHEARIVGANLFRKENLIKNDGTLAVFATSVKGLTVGIAGLNEHRAKEEGLDIIIGESEATNHHPSFLPNTQVIKVKLIFSKSSGEILGGQIMGSESAGEMINILALAIQKKTTIYNFDTLQVSTHPLLTAAPTVYPLITAAQSALTKL